VCNEFCTDSSSAKCAVFGCFFVAEVDFDEATLPAYNMLYAKTQLYSTCLHCVASLETQEHTRVCDRTFSMELS